MSAATSPLPCSALHRTRTHRCDRLRSQDLAKRLCMPVWASCWQHTPSHRQALRCARAHLAVAPQRIGVEKLRHPSHAHARVHVHGCRHRLRGGAVMQPGQRRSACTASARCQTMPCRRSGQRASWPPLRGHVQAHLDSYVVMPPRISTLLLECQAAQQRWSRRAGPTSKTFADCAICGPARTQQRR